MANDCAGYRPGLRNNEELRHVDYTGKKAGLDVMKKSMSAEFFLADTRDHLLAVLTDGEKHSLHNGGSGDDKQSKTEFSTYHHNHEPSIERYFSPYRESVHKGNDI